MSKKIDIGWQSPYRVESYGGLFRRMHFVVFDGTAVSWHSTDHEMICQWAASLNGAYNIGRSSMALDMEVKRQHEAA